MPEKTGLQEIEENPELENLISIYLELRAEDPRESLKAIKEAFRLAERSYANRSDLTNYELDLWQQAEGYLALAQLEREKYLDSEKHWDQALAIHYPVINEGLRTELQSQRALLDTALNAMSFIKAKQWLRDLEASEKISEGLSHTSNAVRADMEKKLFRTYASKAMVNSAQKHYSNASVLLTELDDEEGLQALEEEYRLWLSKMDETILAKQVHQSDTVTHERNIRLENLKAEAEAIENSGLNKEQSALFERYKALQKAIAEEEKANALAIQDKENQIEDQEREILLLEQENELNTLSLEQQKLISEEEALKKRNLTIGLGLLTALLLSLIILYRNKTQSNRRLQQAKDDLAIANDKVASLLQEQLSGDIADTLMQGGIAEVQERFVTVMFVDIRDFTPKVAAMKPEKINEYQNNIFGFMIDIIEAHHGNINQLLGDGFMATFGAPKSFGNDVQNAVDAGLEILKELDLINKKGDLPNTQIGIGIDCGMAVMGNVGNSSRKQFSITGNVVISAARIEQANKIVGSHFLISEEVASHSEITCQQTEHDIALKGRKGKRRLIELLLT